MAKVVADCESSACVEVEAESFGAQTVALTSTLAPEIILRITREEWTAFVKAVKAGEFDQV